MTLSESGLISSIAKQIGASSEPALRLLLTILAGYPISIFYKFVLESRIKNKSLKHIYFLSFGILLYIFNQYVLYHSMIAVAVTYLFTIFLCEKPDLLVKVNFIFHMMYLLLAYYFTESNEYDILWTMPFCVLVLRLIGFGFDIADGKRLETSLSKDQKENCIKEIPNILELAAFSYFPSSFIVGPQFAFNRYKCFINNDFAKYKSFVTAGILRGFLGVLYLVIRQIGAEYLPDDYFLSDEYTKKPFLIQIIQMGLWGKISLYKYISCWLLAEGSLTLLGISYSPKNGNSSSDLLEDWTACSNVKLILLETGSRMLHYVQSFNVNTNNWVASYIYKRLKFLNNRTLSYAGALLFLAVWHGFHSGYYVAFALEYTIITFERQIESFYNNVLKSNRIGHFLENNIIAKSTLFAFMKFYNIAVMGWCLVPFIQLNYDKWMVIYSRSGYWGFYLLGVWIVINLFYEFLFNPKHKNPLLKQKDL